MFLLAISVSAQNASVSGTVTDPSGAVVPNANITITNSETGLVRTAVTSGTGTYSIPDLPAGQYDITVEASGFTTVKLAAVTLTVGQSLTENASLQTGQVSQTVQVDETATAPIELETAQLTTVINQKEMQDLPLLTRNPYDLVGLTPGVMMSNSGLGGYSVNGASERNNNFLLDGQDNNDTSVPGIPGGLLQLNPDATQEFQVISNNFLPEYGRNTGAIVNIITKGGTDQFHGDLYEFNRVRAMAARDFFNTTDQPQNPFVRNDFGYSFGGPIKKDKTFFFVNDEWQRFRTTLTTDSTVPTAAYRSGVFNYDGYNVNLANPGSPNNVLGLPLDPTIQKVLGLLPLPNAGNIDALRGTYRFPQTSQTNDATTAFKVDHRFSDKENVSGRFSYFGFGDPNPAYSDIVPGIGGYGQGEQTYAIGLTLESTFTPTLINEARAGFNRAYSSFTCSGVAAVDALGPLDNNGYGTDYVLPGIGTIGCGVLGDSNGQARLTGTYNFDDALTKVSGAHTMKFGADIRWIFENGDDNFGSRPTDSFNLFSTFGQPAVNLDAANPCSASSSNPGCSDLLLQDMAGALLGVVAQQSQTQFFNKTGQQTATDFRKFRQAEYDGFVQDSWKIFPNLTLNVGMRYEFNTVPYEVNNNLSNLFQYTQGPSPFTFQIVGPGTGHQLYNNDFTGFEPRFGLAWDPFHNGKTSVRGGYGIFHDRIFGNLIGNARGNPPFSESFTAFPGAPVTGLPLPPVQTPSATVTDGAYISPVLFQSDMRLPRSQNWNFGIERELANSLVLEVNYVGSHANYLPRVIDGNQPLPQLVQSWIAQGVNPAALQFNTLVLPVSEGGYPSVLNTALFEPSVNQSTGNSTYNSLQAKLNKRYSHGMDFQVSYTYSHAIDDLADPLVPAAGNRSFPRNSFDLNQERGNSDFDLRHRLVFNFSYELPFGKDKAWMNHGPAATILGNWVLSGIGTFQSGHPFDIFSTTDSQHTLLSQRAELVGNPAIPAGADQTETGPPLSAFAQPAIGQIPNLGRNVFTGPTYYDVDAALLKNFTFTERWRLQFRAESYNLLNRPEFAQPDNSIVDTNTFGYSLSTLQREDGTTSNRQIQLGLKLIF